MELRDDAREVRSGEELDSEKLLAYLKTSLGPSAEDRLSVKQFPGGYSNLTYLVRFGDRELVLRRPPFGSKVKSAHDMGREFRILSSLHGHFPVPRPLLFCEDEAVIGAKFYVMERLTGLILRQKLPADFDLGPEPMQKLCEALLDTQVALHAIDYRAVGLEELGRPEGYVERQVSGWSKRYRDAQTDDVKVIERVMEWLAGHMPASPAATLIHNDLKFDNLVLDPDELTRVRGVLDWEMATIGDPLMDLGTTLCYWIEPSDPIELHGMAFGPTVRPGSLTRRELCERYEKSTGRSLQDIVFYYCFGLFKTAVVLQQIYYRYKQGLTKDPRFAMLGAMATLFTEQAARSIDRNAIS